MIFICFTIVDFPLSPEPIVAQVSKLQQPFISETPGQTEKEHFAFSPYSPGILLKLPVDHLASLLLFHILRRLLAHTETHLRYISE